MWSLHWRFDKGTSNYLPRLGSEGMRRKRDKKYKQGFGESFVIKGTRGMERLLEGEVGPREKWKKKYHVCGYTLLEVMTY